MQPQPKCGFVLVGTDGSISSYDYDAFVTLQTRKAPAPGADPRRRAAARAARRRSTTCSPGSRTARRSPARSIPRSALIGQRMIDSAVLSAASKRTVPLVP